MPVYFGFKPTRDQEVSASLSTKGLSLARCAPSNLSLLANPLITVASYFAYLALLPALIYASFSRNPVSSLRTGFSLPKPPSYLDVALPKLAVSFGSISEDNKKVLESLGFVYAKIRGNDVYLLDQSSVLAFTTVLRMSPIETTPPPFGYVNLAAFRGAMLAIKVLTMFFSIHKLKAFSRKVTDDDYVRVGTQGKRKAVAEAGESSSSAAVSGKTMDREVMPFDKLFKSPTDLGNPDAFTDVEVKSVEPDMAVQYLNQMDMPSFGTLFAYVSDLALPDDSTVVSFISTYLMKALGETLQVQRQSLELLRSSWGHVKTTECGHQLAHMCAVARLAIQAQAYSVPLFYDRYYEGSLLVGMNYELSVAGVIHSPSSAENLAEEVRNMGSHGNALEKILQLLAPNMENMAVPEINSMYDLHFLCADRGIPANTLNEIRRLAHLLRFAPSWPVNPDTLCAMMELATGKQQFGDHCPIRPDVIGSTSRVELALSCFGVRCPSFRIPAGTRIDLEKPLITPTIPTRGRANQKRPNPAAWSINVRLVSLGTAIADWELVLREKTITSVAPATARNAGFRSFSSADRVRLVGMLRECVNATLVDLTTPAMPEDTTSTLAHDSTFDF